MTRDEALEALGLRGNVTPGEVSRTYAECAKKYHPDLYATQPEPVREVMNEKMRRVNLARAVLQGTAPAPGADEAPETGRGLSPNEIFATVDLLIRSERQDQALAYLDALQELNGERWELVHLRSLVFQSLGRHAEAYATLGRLQELDPRFHSDADLCDLKARTAREAGLHEDAEREERRSQALRDGSQPNASPLERHRGGSGPGGGRCGWKARDGRLCAERLAPGSTSYCRTHMADPHAPPAEMRCAFVGKWGNRCASLADADSPFCPMHPAGQKDQLPTRPSSATGDCVPVVVRGKVRLVPKAGGARSTVDEGTSVVGTFDAAARENGLGGCLGLLAALGFIIGIMFLIFASH